MRKSGKEESVKLLWRRRESPAPETRGFHVLESHGPRDADGDSHGLLIQGDNYEALHVLKQKYSGKVDLIYIDPPYGTGRKFVKRTRERGSVLPSMDEPAYEDGREGGLDDYLQMLYTRLVPMRELLATDGSIYVHVDWRHAHYVKILLDELFGIQRFQNEIVWCYREAVNSKKRWNRKHDVIFFYTKGEKFTFNYREVLEPHSEATVKKYRRRDEKGPYRLMGRGLKGSPIRSARDVASEWEESHPELTFRHYLPEGRLPVDYWMMDIVNQASKERTGYGTQKPERLIERIVRASSGDAALVADFFCGSGTLPAVATKLGRRWIACDSSPAAIETTKTRLLALDAPPSFSILKPV